MNREDLIENQIRPWKANGTPPFAAGEIGGAALRETARQTAV